MEKIVKLSPDGTSTLFTLKFNIESKRKSTGGTPPKMPYSHVRPTSVRELNVTLSSFTVSKNSFTIPKAFAAEFVPGLLIAGKKLILEKYRKNPLLAYQRDCILA